MNFDLPDEQKRVRNCNSHKDVYNLWDKACTAYDKGWICAEHLDEMKVVVVEQFVTLAELRAKIDGALQKK